jgi:predicted PurR-regulated permease PerM
MIANFILPMFLAALFAGLAFRFYQKLVKLVRGRESAAAFLTLFTVLTLVVIPLTFFLGIVVDQAVDLTESVTPWVQEELGNQDLLERLEARLPESVQEVLPEMDRIKAKLGELASRIGTFMVNSLAGLTQGTASFFLDLFILLFSMYFFLTRGREILARILYLLPLNSSQENRLLERFISVTRATIKGTLVIGIVQGMLGGLGFFFVGIPGAAFWATIMAVLSIIPAVGAALVWVPAVVYLLAVGQVGPGLFLLAWSGIIVSSSDNVLRPKLVGRDAKMPDLMILIGTLGGISMFGATGVVVGPVLAALFMTLWDLYGEAFADDLEEVVLPGGTKGELANF